MSKLDEALKGYASSQGGTSKLDRALQTYSPQSVQSDTQNYIDAARTVPYGVESSFADGLKKTDESTLDKTLRQYKGAQYKIDKARRKIHRKQEQLILEGRNQEADAITDAITGQPKDPTTKGGVWEAVKSGGKAALEALDVPHEYLVRRPGRMAMGGDYFGEGYSNKQFTEDLRGSAAKPLIEGVDTIGKYAMGYPVAGVASLFGGYDEENFQKTAEETGKDFTEAAVGLVDPLMLVSRGRNVAAGVEEAIKATNKAAKAAGLEKSVAAGLAAQVDDIVRAGGDNLETMNKAREVLRKGGVPDNVIKDHFGHNLELLTSNRLHVAGKHVETPGKMFRAAKKRIDPKLANMGMRPIGADLTKGAQLQARQTRGVVHQEDKAVLKDIFDQIPEGSKAATKLDEIMRSDEAVEKLDDIFGEGAGKLKQDLIDEGFGDIKPSEVTGFVSKHNPMRADALDQMIGQSARESKKVAQKKLERDLLKDYSIEGGFKYDGPTVKYGKHTVPKYVGKILRGTFAENLSLARSLPGPFGKVAEFYENVLLSAAKSRILMNRPGYHVVNFMNDTTQMLAAGMDNPVKWLLAARKELRNPNSTVMRELQARGIGAGAGVRMEGGVAAKGLQKRDLQRALKQRSGKSTKLGETYDKVGGTGAAVADKWENLSKTAMALFEMSRGANADQAAKKALDVLIDYGANDIPTRALANFAPFIRWAVHAPQMTAKIAATKPGRLAQAPRIADAFTEDPKFEKPGYLNHDRVLSEHSAIRSAMDGLRGLAGAEKTGGDTYLNFRLPFEEAMTPSSVLEQAGPATKFFMENIAGDGSIMPGRKMRSTEIGAAFPYNSMPEPLRGLEASEGQIPWMSYAAPFFPVLGDKTVQMGLNAASGMTAPEPIPGVDQRLLPFGMGRPTSAPINEQLVRSFWNYLTGMYSSQGTAASGLMNRAYSKEVEDLP